MKLNRDGSYTPHKSGQRLSGIHPKSACKGQLCPIHNWGDHHMVDWEQHWRDDKGCFERICPHGIGHPDPADRYYKINEYNGIHGCDGCCTPPKPEPNHDLLKTV